MNVTTWSMMIVLASVQQQTRQGFTKFTFCDYSTLLFLLLTEGILAAVMGLIDPSRRPKRPTFIEASEESWSEVRDLIKDRFSDGMKARLYPLGKFFLYDHE